MSQIVSFEDYTPPARFDSVAWSEVRISESDISALSDATVWTQIDVVSLTPLDPDPSNPATRSFTTDQASDTPDLWYRVVFADGSGNTSLPSVPVQNLEFPVAAYATVAELLRLLKVRTPTSDQEDAAQGDLDTATIEINAEIDLSADAAALTAEQLELVRGVCLDRAADLWRHRESMPGITGLLGDEATGPAPGRYSWERYAQRLSPLKSQWGIA